MEAQNRDPSLVITGSRVYTGDALRPWAEAVVTRGNRIHFVGDETDALREAGPSAERMDIPGGLVTAGLNDAHVHIDKGSYNLTTLSLEGIFTVEDVQQRLREYAEANPDRRWIQGWGLPYEPFDGATRPEREILDEAVAGRPVIITAFDGHSAWANTLGLRMAGIERGADIPLPNEVVVDPQTGLATGMLKEELAKRQIERVIGDPTQDELDDMLCGGMRHMNQLGITSVQDMMSGVPRMEQVDRLLQQGKVTLRTYHYQHLREEMPRDYVHECREATRRFQDAWNRSCGIKMFIDGVVEAKTAWMTNPYADGSGDLGVPDMSPEYYREVVIDADRLGMDVATHAIGEQGVRHALRSYIAAQEANGGRRERRHRIEHIETSHPEDVPLFGAHGITASMQPLHAVPTTDPGSTPWTRLVGSNREANAFPWRYLLETGAPLAFGSDWPIVTCDVRTGLHAALTRQTVHGEPAGGWHPQLCITLAQALDAYTSGAAYAERQEHLKGTLREGMLADITVFAEDLFRLRPREILAVPIALTVVDGRVVHRQE